MSEMRLFEAFEDDAGQWRWRLWAPDYRLLASSGEAYASQAEALSAAEAVRENASDAYISSTPGLGMPAARRLRALLSDAPPATPSRAFPAGRAVMRRVSLRPTGASTAARVHVH